MSVEERVWVKWWTHSVILVLSLVQRHVCMNIPVRTQARTVRAQGREGSGDQEGTKITGG